MRTDKLETHINKIKTKDNSNHFSRNKEQLSFSHEELTELTKQYLEQGGKITKLPPGSAEGTSSIYENHIKGYGSVDVNHKRKNKIFYSSNQNNA